MKRLLLASALVLATGTASFAADAIEPAMPMEEAPMVFSWTGVYLGAQAGYLWGDGSLVFTNGDFSNTSPDGFLGGIYAGANMQLNNGFVIGAEADIAWTNADDNAVGFNAAGVQYPFPANGFEQDVNWTGAVRARLGYAVDRFLPYIAGGVAFADVNQTLVSAGVAYNRDNTYTGWTLGGGVEYAFTDNLIGRLEYRYTDFGDVDFGADGFLLPQTTDLTTNDVRVGISYKF